jgi:hypothetical protein
MTTEFLAQLNEMIESTEEFIADDGLRADDQRVHDLSALLTVRELYTALHEEPQSYFPTTLDFEEPPR